MIIRINRALEEKLGQPPSPAMGRSSSPYADWTARLFTVENTPYILVSNTLCLYSAVLYGHEINTVSTLASSLEFQLKEVLDGDGHMFLFRRLVAPLLSEIQLAREWGPAVAAAMDSLVLHAKAMITDHDLSPFEASLMINDLSLPYLNFGFPRTEFPRMKIDKKLNS